MGKMRRCTGRILTGAMSAAMILGGYGENGFIALAETTEESGLESDVDGEQGTEPLLSVSEPQFTAEESKEKLLKESKSFPERFDLRNVDTDGDGIGDRCYVTGVKLQEPFGTCWGFAAVSSAESLPI